MKKKPENREVVITFITVLIAIFVVIMTIFFNKYQDAQHDKAEYKRLVSIYRKADDNNGETKKRYIQRLNRAEEELKKVKEETNYKGYNDKSEKAREREDSETHDHIYDAGNDKDLILVKSHIEFSDSVTKPEILVDDKGIGTITVPRNKGYEEQTIGSIIDTIVKPPIVSTPEPIIEPNPIVTNPIVVPPTVVEPSKPSIPIIPTPDPTPVPTPLPPNDNPKPEPPSDNTKPDNPSDSGSDNVKPTPPDNDSSKPNTDGDVDNNDTNPEPPSDNTKPEPPTGDSDNNNPKSDIDSSSDNTTSENPDNSMDDNDNSKPNTEEPSDNTKPDDSSTDMIETN